MVRLRLLYYMYRLRHDLRHGQRKGDSRRIEPNCAKLSCKTGSAVTFATLKKMPFFVFPRCSR